MPKPEMKKPYVTSDMNIPKNYLYTGNIQLLEAYLASNGGHPMSYGGKPLNAASIQHLKDRIANMKYIEELANEAKKSGTKLRPKKAVKLPSGGALLTNIHQPKRQETGWNCWTMPFILMLQSRGINIDQMTVRCMKPDLTMQQCMDVDPQDGTMFTMETTGNIRNLAGMLHKFVPNAAMSQSIFQIYPTQEQNKASMEIFKKRVREALEVHGSPVALLVGNHYRTIVGIDGDNVILKDSLSVHGPDENLREPISEIFKGTPFISNVEISFVKDLTLKKDGSLPEELAGHAKALKFSPDGTFAENKDVEKHKTGEYDFSISYSTGAFAERGSTVVVGKTEEIKVGNKHVDSGEALYLPPKLDYNVADIEPLEEAEYQFGENSVIFNEEDNVHLIRDVADTDFTLRALSLKEDLYAQSLGSGVQYEMVQYANECRQMLRELSFKAANQKRNLTPEEMSQAREYISGMVASRYLDVEKAISDKNPSPVEQSILKAGSPDEFINSKEVQTLVDKVFDIDAKNYAKEINDFIIKDKAAAAVKNYVKENIKSADVETKAKVAKAAENALDPNHEIALLKGHLDNLEKSASKAWRNSTEYKDLKKCVKTIIEIRSDMKNGDVSNAEILRDAYDGLRGAAEAYKAIKDPSKLKPDSVDYLKFKAATEVGMFAKTQAGAYDNVAKHYAKTELKAAAPNVDQPSKNGFQLF